MPRAFAAVAGQAHCAYGGWAGPDVSKAAARGVTFLSIPPRQPPPQEDFEAAAQVASHELPDTLSNDEKLELYALFKQSKEVCVVFVMVGVRWRRPRQRGGGCADPHPRNPLRPDAAAAAVVRRCLPGCRRATATPAAPPSWTPRAGQSGLRGTRRRVRGRDAAGAGEAGGTVRMTSWVIRTCTLGLCTI